MDAKSFARSAGIVAFGLTSCTAGPEPGQLVPAANPVPPPEFSRELPLERELPHKYPPARACLLGSTGSCMDLDPRPFAPCLVEGKKCEVEGTRIVPLELKAPADPGAPGSR